MNLTLVIDGKEKKFVSGFVPAILYRRLLDMNKRVDYNNLSPEEMDELVESVRNLFNNEFTIDEFYNGVSVKELVPTLSKAIAVINGLDKEEEADETVKK
jgi:hypothetical protein